MQIIKKSHFQIRWMTLENRWMTISYNKTCCLKRLTNICTSNPPLNHWLNQRLKLCKRLLSCPEWRKLLETIPSSAYIQSDQNTDGKISKNIKRPITLTVVIVWCNLIIKFYLVPLEFFKLGNTNSDPERRNRDFPP